MASEYEKDRRLLFCDGHSLLTWSSPDVSMRLDWDVDMLRYLVQHMEPAWANRMLKAVATVLEHQLAVSAEVNSSRKGTWVCRRTLLKAKQSKFVKVPWHVIIFLGNKLGDELPAGLAKVAATG